MYIRVLLPILLIFSVAHSQVRIIPVDDEGKEIPNDTSRWMAKYEIDILKSARISYHKPASLTEVRGSECFRGNPKLEEVVSCAGNQLHSKNGDFIAFLPVYKFLTKMDSVRMQKSFPGMPIVDLDNQHAAMVRAKVLLSLSKNASIRGENADFNWRQYVTYYSDKDARRKFNADTAIKVPFPLKKEEAYLGKYNNLIALVLQKNGRGFVIIYCFYTDKAKRKLNYYWKQIEGIYRYED